GDDRLAIKGIYTTTRIYSGAGNDTINLGSTATVNGVDNPDAPAFIRGTLNNIGAPLIIDGQGPGDHDVLSVDDSGDTAQNMGTLTATTITNGVVGGGMLMGVGGSITYLTMEVLNIHLGDALAGNVFSIESTHGNGAVTNFTSLDGPDVVNIETVDGDLA